MEPTPLSSVNPSTRSPRGAARRNQILDAAIELFRTKGFGATTIDDIGAAVGITGPAVYHHFDSKQQLLAAAFWRVGDQFLGRAPELFVNNDSPDERLEALVRHTVGVIEQYRAAVPLLYVQDHHLDPPDLEITMERRDRIAAVWYDTIAAVRPDLSHAQIADMGAALNSMISAFAWRRPALSDPGDRAELLVEMALATVRRTRRPQQSLSEYR